MIKALFQYVQLTVCACYYPYHEQGNPAVQSATIRMLGTDEFPFTWVLPGHGTSPTYYLLIA